MIFSPSDSVLPLGSGRGAGEESSTGEGETETLPFLTPRWPFLTMISREPERLSASITGIPSSCLTTLLGTSRVLETVLQAVHDLNLFNACKN